MSHVQADRGPRVPKVWIALRRLDTNDEQPLALQEVSVPPAADGTWTRQIISSSFGLTSTSLIFKMRNQRGSLIPLNNSLPTNTKHRPHALEVAKIFQHVHPRPRTIPAALINESIKARLQAIDKRIQRLEELLPQLQLQRSETLSQELECLGQKLGFLQQRMQVAESHRWKGALTRAPLW